LLDTFAKTIQGNDFLQKSSDFEMASLFIIL
jgi:hypothetical protein